MDNQVAKQCDQLEQQIAKLNLCVDPNEQGLMLADCYQLLQPLLEGMMGYPERCQVRIIGFKSDLIRYNKAFLLRIEFQYLVEDATKLNQLLLKRDCSQLDEVMWIVKDIRARAEQVQQAKLSFREIKLLKDIEKLVVQAEMLQQPKPQISNIMLSTRLEEIESSSIDPQSLIGVEKAVQEMNRVARMISQNGDVSQQLQVQGPNDSISSSEEILVRARAISKHRENMDRRFSALHSLLKFVKRLGRKIKGIFRFGKERKTDKLQQSQLQQNQFD